MGIGQKLLGHVAHAAFFGVVIGVDVLDRLARVREDRTAARRRDATRMRDLSEARLREAGYLTDPWPPGERLEEEALEEAWDQAIR